MNLLITTSRRPSKRTRSFIKDLALIFGGVKFNRGKYSLEELIARLGDEDRLVVVDTKKGNPSRMRIYGKHGLLKTYLIRKVKLLREFKDIDYKKINKISISTDNEFLKNFINILNIRTNSNKVSLKIEINESKDEKFQEYKEFVLKKNSYILGPIFLIKEANDRRNKTGNLI
jgi:U3 small nucleolar ribonucleoprotein protein IMP4